MLPTISESQRQISNYENGKVVVKACPGSGKTFSVAGRIARLLQQKRFIHKGIAALSFTNVACDEIKGKLIEFNANHLNQHPHFIGTLNNFINHYIFLPYGHLIMQCNRRPEIVGDKYHPWTKGKGQHEYRYIPGRGRVIVNPNLDAYFDGISFNLQNEVIPIVPERELQGVSLNRDSYYKVNGEPRKIIQDIINSKWKHFRDGFANQSDATYIALKVIESFTLVAKNLAAQFEYVIIDEAQDTDEIQMRILEILVLNGIDNIMLIGDRDQSIFEWNNARPELFDQKFSEWNKIVLTENRRSSQKICNFISHLSSFPHIRAVDPVVSRFDHSPQILPFKFPSTSKKYPVPFEESKKSFDKILQYFFATCQENEVPTTPTSIAILYRGKDYSKYVGEAHDPVIPEVLPWEPKHYHVRDIIKGKYLIDKNNLVHGYKLIEKAFLEAEMKVSSPDFYCSAEHLRKVYDGTSLIAHRDRIFKFVELLPSTIGKTVSQWTNESNQKLQHYNYPFRFKINTSRGNIDIQALFHESTTTPLINSSFYHGTIHSAKGKTFDAVLLILSQKAGNKSYYSTMLTVGPKEGEDEELRNIYVAISRPRKILFLAVPEQDLQVWKHKFKV